MAGLITVAELVARPGFEGLDSGQAQALIDDASALAREAATPELDAVESPATPPAVVAVLVNMIRRGWTNPLGHAQEQLGDYSYSTGGHAVATLYLTARERRIVRRAAGKLGVSSLTLTSNLPVQPSEPLVGDEIP
ncbi:MAG: hypothetical protein L0206_01145 [Actinobacteria bacterium]|nr:hypothetical protein [Actinomycetota bacterium]